MVRRSALFCIITLFLLLGCASDKIATTESGARCPDTCKAVLAYLRDEKVQDLERVKVWKNEYGPGLKLFTGHYKIYTTLLKPLMLCRIPGFMESAYAAYNCQLPEPVEAKCKFTIYLFADRRQWEDFTRHFAGEQADIFCQIKAGAYYHNGACVVYDIGWQRTLSVLGHEGWHQFSDNHFAFRLPSWLDEGVATHFEAHETENGTFHFEPARNTYRLDALSRALSNGKMMPLEELIATQPGDVLATDQAEAVMAFYSQSYALVRFLREARCGQHIGTYQRLLADGLRGDWPLDEVSKHIAADRTMPRNVLWNHVVGLVLFQEYIGADFEPVEKEYIAFCRRITRQIEIRNPNIEIRNNIE
ncbi:MAG: hypothetical protein A2Z25_02855 [Planctomycetes bacterium RBG_16_55_9]|nr:MAG: hypothetical protein A2Z25_02855 [Planctomycetes bacterium RBG_16_55_9]